MSIHQHTLALLSVLLLLSASFVHSSSKLKTTLELKEKIQNDQWKQWQQEYCTAMEVKTKAPPVAAPDQRLLDYKALIFQHITSKGADQEQLRSVSDKFTKGELSAFKASFLEMSRTFPSSDNPKFFFGDEPYSTLIKSIPQSGTAKIAPWSTTHWPTRNGGISVRYCWSSMNTIGVINRNQGSYQTYYIWRSSVGKYSQPSEYNYYSRSNVASVIDSWYSASEKYDVAMGDTLNFSLTNFIKRDGARFVTNGDIPSWYGICHGWCPASYYFPKPIKPVTITGATGVAIRFLPDDIKALCSQFFANVSYTTRWIGNRCDIPITSASWSRNSNCRSINPGSFLITLGNWIGIGNHNLVIDPKADDEIWNQPLYKYSLRYYNPITGSFYANPDSAKVTQNQLRYCGSSWCSNIRSTCSEAAYVVGAFFQVTYSVENNPQHSYVSQNDAWKTGSFDSAISLDENGNIIGGSWRYNVYPNFMWRADEELDISGVSDAAAIAYDGKSSTLKTYTSIVRAASNKGQVLKSFIQWLAKAASSNPY